MMLKQLMKIRSSFMVFVGALLLSVTAFAAPQVSMEVIAEKEIVEVDKKGKKVTKRVVAEDTVPGDVLFYTIRYKNTGDEAATNITVNNPIPQGTTYRAKSAWGQEGEIFFSIDEKADNQVFKKASQLSYQITDKDGKAEKKVASPEQYRSIRWVIAEIPENGKGEVGFSVVVN